ncbi:hypothetical protein AX774_g2364 [Zancudomyces culisetae]|uniref:Uncharacterized protein n=1 Tax=Zancudomyces culisetae TaxID=1213189 RepID=A0A1R1PT82_ZANCU|nr:hypothetical protein AX774_g2364 [Zancudomyces culisetae]|eukprot:OMH84113.1 hypothetical protein AX774_g2364 [Zancudomyces culisetae]
MPKEVLHPLCSSAASLPDGLEFRTASTFFGTYINALSASLNPAGTILILRSGFSAVAPNAIKLTPIFSGSNFVWSCDPPSGNIPIHCSCFNL